MTLVEHFERTLGRMTGGWTHDADGRRMSFQIAQFETAVSTLGLSNHELDQGEGRTIRQELVMLFRAGTDLANRPALLQQVSEAALAQHRAYLQGEVIGPRGPLFEGSCYEALYVALPVYLPDEFWLFDPTGHDPTVIAWLVPITHGEAHLVQRRGWKFFESLLLEHDPDLLAPEREGVDVMLRD